MAWAALYAVTPFLVPWLVARKYRLYGAPCSRCTARSGSRIPLESQAIGLAFLLLGVARGEDVVDWDSALAIAIVVAAAAMLVVSAVLSRRAT